MKLLCSATALLFMTLLFSCKDEYSICNVSKSVNFTGGFYQRSGNVDVAVTAPLLSVSFLNNPATLFTQANAPTVVIPLNPLPDSARYLISLSNTLPADTLTIVYTSAIVNISAECGDITANTISRCYSTLHTIDSVKIIAPVVNNNPVQNVKIYF